MTAVIIASAAALAFALALGALRLFWVRRNLVLVTVEGHSMTPTLTDGDRVLVRRRELRHVRTGDIVVLRAPTTGPYAALPLGPQWNVKRVAALPGEPVPTGVPGEAVVPPGNFAVLGDNLDGSVDSRHRGLFTGEQLMGVMLRKLPSP